MLRRLTIGVGVATVLGTSAWRGLVSEYFGRIDPVAWDAEHPAPPAPPVSLGRHRVEMSHTDRVVPSQGLPPEARVQTANNNLDVVRHRGRVYLAFRSAPSHFAGTETSIEVVSSADEKTWRFEGHFAPGYDLREPRFLSLGERLFLYVSRLGKNPFDFEPKGISVSELSDGRFGELEPVYQPGYIAWRARAIDGRGVVVAYGGGHNVYSFGTDPIEVELLSTTDGRTFTPLDPKRRAVLSGGASETDFTLLADGSLFAVARNEAGDVSGWGSKLCTAPADAIANWTCRSDPKKYDSPLVFSHDGEVYVVARRNRTTDGLYDVATGPRPYRTLRNQLAYITSAKRCALFRWHRTTNELGFVLDLPSRGDTCFPSVIDGSTPDEKVIYNYSSDVEGPDLPWAAGQRANTYVYRHVLRFHPHSPSAEASE